MDELQTEKQEAFIRTFQDPDFIEDLKEGAEIEEKTIITETKETVELTKDENIDVDPSYKKCTDTKIFSSPPKIETDTKEEQQFVEVDLESGIKKHTNLVKEESRIVRVNYMTERRAKSVFERFDVNQDGKLDKDEISNLVSSSEQCDIPEKVARKIIKMGDKNKDNTLSFEEFYKMVTTKENVFQPVISRYYELFRIQNPDYKYPTAMIIISMAQALCFWINTEKECKLEDVFKYCSCNGDDAWRIFFYMFIHDSSSMLIMNIVIQLLMAIPLETHHAWWRVTIVYFCGGIGAALGHTVTGQTGPLIGASAGVYALISANFAFIVLNWKELKKIALYQTVYSVILLMLIMTITFSQNSGFVYLFGIISGFLIGMYFMENFDKDRNEEQCSSASIIIYILFVLIGIIYLCIHMKMRCEDDGCRGQNSCSTMQ